MGERDTSLRERTTLWIAIDDHDRDFEASLGFRP
jgi:hypothetical protein